MSKFSDLKDAYAALGPLRFWTIMGATLAFILAFVALETWLSAKLGWPEAFGFECPRRGSLLTKMGHSERLLEVGGAYAWGLFALYWAMPTIAAGYVAVVRFKRRRRNPILPME